MSLPNQQIQIINNSQRFLISLPSDWAAKDFSLHSFKQLVFKELGYSSSLQRLIYQGRLLQDSQIISSIIGRSTEVFTFLIPFLGSSIFSPRGFSSSKRL
jgi:hypothetical protein